MAPLRAWPRWWCSRPAPGCPRSPTGWRTATGLTRSFVGTLWLAFATSLPEIAVTLSRCAWARSTWRSRNLLGSNLFNVVVLAVDDAVYLRGPLLADAAPVHAGTAVAAIVMTGLVMIGLVMRPQPRCAC